MNRPDETEPQPDGAETAETALANNDVGLMRRVMRPRTIVSFLFSFAILVFFATRINIEPGDVIAKLAGANPALMVLGFVFYYLSFPVRAVRWRLLLQNAGVVSRLRRPSVAALTEMIFLSWFANCIVPAKLGDAYRGYMLKHRHGVSFSATFGTILTERIVDVLVLFGLLVVAGFIAFRGHLPDELLYLLGLGGVLVAVVVVGLVSLRGLRPLVERLLPQRLHHLYHRFEAALRSSFQPKTAPALLALTGVVWVLEGLRLYAVCGALGIRLGLSVTLFIALASSLLTTIPFTPAGLGFVESAVVTVLLWFKFEAASAFSVSFLDRLISYWSIIVFGLIVYLIVANRDRLRGTAGRVAVPPGR